MKRMFTVLAVALVMAAMMVATAMPAFAQGSGGGGIQPVDTGSTNPGGKMAPGQQPTAQGQGQTQMTENQNPAGKAPAGQNK